MIEKKTMGYVDFEYPQCEAKAVAVIIDSETGKVELYRPDENDNDWYATKELEHFYPTVDEANTALKKYRNDLLSRMGEVKQYVEIMNNWLVEQEGDNQKFEERDYLPSKNRRGSRDSYYEKEYERVDKLNDYLIAIIRTGFINIKGESFKVEDVKHIKWGKYRAELILTDDRHIESGHLYEFDVIKYLFGSNFSQYTFPRLDEKSE